VLYLAAIILSLASANAQQRVELETHVSTKILDEFKSSGTKELFKVFHFLFSKEYDYNTEEGIARYKIFKANVKKIDEHNAQNLSYQMGINHLTDMTWDEVKTYYNLKTIDVDEMSKLKRSLRAVLLDDFNDDDNNNDDNNDDDHNVTNNKAPQARIAIDHRGFMKSVRNQGSCGSCWAFATMGAIEGNYGKIVLKTWLTDYLSPQQMVDCDTRDSACNGGWMTSAYTYAKSVKLCFNAAYPYKGVKQTCKYSSMTSFSPVKITGYNYAYTSDMTYSSLLTGPIAVAVDANSRFSSYRSGVFDGPCANSVNHAVILIGYSPSDSSWLVRNSWGTSWGSSGYIKIKDNVNNNNSCMLTKYAYRPVL